MENNNDGYQKLFNEASLQIFNAIADQADASEIVKICEEYIEKALFNFKNHMDIVGKIDCKKGCSFCCNFPITTPPEMIIDIARFLRTSSSNKDLSMLIDEMKQSEARRHGPYMRGRCPFLDDEGVCKIYAKRPLACRWFTSPDSEICRKSLEDGRNIPQHQIYQFIYQAATVAILAAAKENGRHFEQVPFIKSLIEVLEIEEKETIWLGNKVYQ